MPTYQYACTACDERLEVIQKFTDDPLTVCEVCGGPLRKVYSAVGIVFKGSGFYRNDSRNGSGSDKDKPVKAGEGASSNGDGGGSPDGKTSGSPGDKSGSGAAPDGKPAKKTEAASKGGSGSGSKVA
ncbi:MAG TPA: FmdB family zinc ribbon protein [Streptosporangiaceae bacterium]